MAAGAKERRPPRVVLHLDLDCFYAQVEEVRNPALRGRPMGVSQKFLLVTCNYSARALKVPKMVPVAEARAVCPDLIVINGEDLTPYRQASQAIYQVVRGFTDRIERLVLDELYVDATELVADRRRRGACTPGRFEGYTVGRPSGSAPTDSAAQEAAAAVAAAWRAAEATSAPADAAADKDEEAEALAVGSQLLAEIRQAVFDRVGYTCSGGVSVNKLLAKLASGLRKPNQQSVLLPAAVPALLPPLPVQKLTGIGYRLTGQLRDGLHVETVADLLRFPQAYLVDKFGARIGEFLYDIARGIDRAEVVATGAPKSISEEDSFMVCSSLDDARRKLEGLAESLLVRIDEDADAFGRHPTQFRLGARITDAASVARATAEGGAAAEYYFARTTKTVPFPLDVLDRRAADVPTRARTFVAATALPLLRRLIGDAAAGGFNITLLNVCATTFVDAPPATTIKGFFASKASTPPPAAASPATDVTKDAPRPAPPADWDPDVLAELPEDIRAELLAGAATAPPAAAAPESDAAANGIDLSVWDALPPEVQAELAAAGPYRHLVPGGARSPVPSERPAAPKSVGVPPAGGPAKRARTAAPAASGTRDLRAWMTKP